MIKEIKLSGYRAFKEANVPLGKITLLVGPNNSGKSSIMSVFRILAQTLRSYDQTVPLLLNGPLGDFGTYRELVNGNRPNKKINIGFSVVKQEKPTAFSVRQRINKNFNLDL